MTLIDIRQIAEMMGRTPNQAWQHHRRAREVAQGVRPNNPPVMPDPEVSAVNGQKLWEEEKIRAWLDEREKTGRNRMVKMPGLHLRPPDSRKYPAAARALVEALGLEAPGGVKREFAVTPNYKDGTVTVDLTTRHTLTIKEYQETVRGTLR